MSTPQQYHKDSQTALKKYMDDHRKRVVNEAENKKKRKGWFGEAIKRSAEKKKEVENKPKHGGWPNEEKKEENEE